MSRVLFIKANSRPVEAAVSVKLYYAFLDQYKKSHAEDEVIELDLFKENLAYYDTNKINGMFKLAKGFDLTPDEKEATEVVNRYLNQFLEADKIVLAFPLWNFTVPAVLHTYFDYLFQSGKTFAYTPDGPVGLVPNKKVALLNAKGSVFSKGPLADKEMAVNYVTNCLNFFGITDITTVIIEGHHQYPDQAETIIEQGIQKAIAVATDF